MTLDILVRNVALWGSEGLCDLGIAGGRFVSVGNGAAP
ncbi:MAG: Cytosine deaminase, partial [Bradyrhizobium sp.]|nr:Cytosine deaminase [Bradyrhizobium sp.]